MIIIQGMGVEHAYGPSIVLFTVLVRLLLFPVTYLQLASSQKTLALAPKLAEIKAKYEDKNIQNQLIASLYQETNVNPLAGCLPAILQIPGPCVYCSVVYYDKPIVHRLRCE